MKIRRTVAQKDLAESPNHGWNAFINLIATEKFEDLSSIQKTASLAFWYDAEVYNGGHFQYFENSAGRRSAETVPALEHIGASCQALVLTRAIAIWSSEPRTRIEGVGEFCQRAGEGEFKQLDRDYHRCASKIHDHLRAFLKNHFQEFIDLS